MLHDIANSVNKSEFVSIFADETADISNREQLVICVRWIDDKFEAHEDFIGLRHLETTSAASIVEEIKNILKSMGVPLAKLRGQCYDGCSTMSGAKSGVATVIKAEEPRALYTHCYGHATNLACASSIKNVKLIRDVHDTVQEITKLVKNSPKRDTHLQRMKNDLDDEDERKDAPGIRMLCPVRWTMRGKALYSIIRNYSLLQGLWEWSLETTQDSEMKARVRGVSAHMEQFSFFFGLSLGEALLRHSDNLAAALQHHEMSASQAQEIAKMTRETLCSIRSDEAFHLFWEKTCRQAKVSQVNDPYLPRQQRRPARLEEGCSAPEFPSTVEDHYRGIYFEALDSLTTCLTDRFDQQDFETYSKCEQLLLNAVNGQDYDKQLQDVCDFYGQDLDQSRLSVQLQILAQEMSGGNKKLSAVVQHFKSLSVSKLALMSEVGLLLKLILVMPATNAVSERTFSAMRRVKNYLRSSSTEERLNHLMLLHVHKQRTDSLDLVKLANTFASSQHRREVFGTFSILDNCKLGVITKTKGTQTDSILL